MKPLCFFIIALLGAAVVQPHPADAQTQSAKKWAYFGTNGKLKYDLDSEQNRIPDFSYAGYRNGMPVPSTAQIKADFGLPAEVVVSGPVAGNPTGGIQAAINTACNYQLKNAVDNAAAHNKPDYLTPPRYRAIVKLMAGLYWLTQPINVNCDGLILQGVGNGWDPATNTVLKADYQITEDVMIVGAANKNGAGFESWTRFSFTRTAASGLIPINAKQILLTSGTPSFVVGDNVIVEQPCTQKWIDDREKGGVYQLTGNPPARPEWKCTNDPPGSRQSLIVKYHRYVTGISGNTITLDAPIYDHVNRENNVFVGKHNPTVPAISHIGVENLRIDIRYHPGVLYYDPYSGETVEADLNHAKNGIKLWKVDNAWLRNLVIYQFSHAGITTDQATRITIDNVVTGFPISPIEGGYRYNFGIGGYSQLILVKNSQAWNGRHHYMSNGGASASGLVFLRNVSDHAYEANDGHRRWTHGILWDKHREWDVLTNKVYNVKYTTHALYNYHYWGEGPQNAGHGYATAQSVVWNVDVNSGGIRLQKPPLAQNYLIGVSNKGSISCGHTNGPAPWQDCIFGVYRASLASDQPQSLYETQLAERTDLNFLFAKRGDVTPAPAENAADLPGAFSLHANYPNPFNPATQIQFDVPFATHLTLDVIDVLGRNVARLVNGTVDAGQHSVRFDAGDLASGMYIYRLTAGTFTDTKRMMLIK